MQVLIYVFPVEKASEKCFTYTLPDELTCVSTETKKLLLGVFESTANHKANKIVVYVCMPDSKGKFEIIYNYIHI